MSAPSHPDLSEDIHRGVAALVFKGGQFRGKQPRLDVSVAETWDFSGRIEQEAAYAAIEEHKMFLNEIRRGEHNDKPTHVSGHLLAAFMCQPGNDKPGTPGLEPLKSAYRSALAAHLISRVEAEGREVLDRLSHPWLDPEDYEGD